MSYIYRHNKELTSYSRANRKNQTDVEKILWHHLRNKQIEGLKFRRQYPVGSYILDFYCIESQLAIELDGSQHIGNKSYDTIRSQYFNKLGIEILRFWDNEIIENIDGVLEVVRNKVTQNLT
jgi:very-short-patch-repair endonuclease